MESLEAQDAKSPKQLDDKKKNCRKNKAEIKEKGPTGRNRFPAMRNSLEKFPIKKNSLEIQFWYLLSANTCHKYKAVKLEKSLVIVF